MQWENVGEFWAQEWDNLTQVFKDHSHSLWRTGYKWIIMEQCKLLRHCYSDPDKGPWQCVGRPLRWWKVSRFSLIFDTELEVRAFRICCGLHVRSPTEWGIRAIPCLCPEQLDGAVAILGGSNEGGEISKKINHGNTVVEKPLKNRTGDFEYMSEALWWDFIIIVI